MGSFTRGPGSTPEPPKASAFNLVGFSVTGEDHLDGEQIGSGNQDCFGTREVPRGWIVVVSDGCGSARDSKTGSAAMVRLGLNGCEELLQGEGEIPTPAEFCTRLERYLLDGISAAASPFARSVDQRNQVLFDSYQATVWIGVVTPAWTAIFGVGDGFRAVNDDQKEEKPRARNEPEYLVYKLMVPTPEGYENVRLRVCEAIETDRLRSLMLATDGVEPIVRFVEGRLSIRELWRERRYRDQKTVGDSIQQLAQPRVQLVVRTKQDGRQAEVAAVRKRGLFADDATCVVVVRTEAPLPAAWLEYRRTFAAAAAEPVAPPAPVLVAVATDAADEAFVRAALESTPAAPPKELIIPVLVPALKPSFLNRLRGWGARLARGGVWLLQLLLRPLAAAWKRVRDRRRKDKKQ